MSGTFDSNVGSVDFYEGTVASNASNTLAAQTYVFPYDAEVVAAAISGQTGTTLANVWANVKVTPAGTALLATTGTSLFSRPSAAATIASVKLDQSYVTLNAAVATSGAVVAAGVTNTTALVLATGQGARFSVGQGIVVGTASTPGNYIVSISSDTLTLNRPVTAAGTTPVAAFTSPTPQPGQQVQILGVTNTAVSGVTTNFFSILNNVTTGAPGATAYTVVDSTESTTGQSFRIGPLKQAGLYDTTTGFWRFTTDRVSLTAGTFQILDAPVLATPAAAGRGSATFNAPDITPIIPAGSTLSVEWNSVNVAGSAVTGVIATNVSLNLAIKKR